MSKSSKLYSFFGAIVACGVIGYGLGLVIFVGAAENPAFAPMLAAALMLVGGIFALIGYLIANAAERKGRSWATFFWLSILVSPLLMGIIIAVLPSQNGTASNSNQIDPSQQLERLSELKKQGVLTQSEFDAKKKELLDRI